MAKSLSERYNGAVPKAYFAGFTAIRPKHSVEQGDSLAWLAAAHAEADGGNEAAYASLFKRYGCSPDRISKRGHEVALADTPKSESFAYRTDVYAEGAERLFGEAYPAGCEAPRHLIHVTCTGYVSPSAAQLLVARRGWPTTVTHAYHMGCAGALPAVRIASAFAADGGRVDVVHTELCSLHMDPYENAPEQLVAHGLFADGCVRYTATKEAPAGSSLELLATIEKLVPDTEDAMTWRPGERAMRMTLAKRMPTLVREHIAPFFENLFEAAGAGSMAEHKDAAWAIHPGGPKILDSARDALGIADARLEWSRRVLFENGNMSSATLPHVWKLILEDAAVPAGTLVPSVAFGPGLTVSGALFRKKA
jgi:predicted naringenin-chalcone synthase